jgi:hypothetical protein
VEGVTPDEFDPAACRLPGELEASLEINDLIKALAEKEGSLRRIVSKPLFHVIRYAKSRLADSRLADSRYAISRNKRSKRFFFAQSRSMHGEEPSLNRLA